MTHKVKAHTRGGRKVKAHTRTLGKTGTKKPYLTPAKRKAQAVTSRKYDSPKMMHSLINVRGDMQKDSHPKYRTRQDRG